MRELIVLLSLILTSPESDRVKTFLQERYPEREFQTRQQGEFLMADAGDAQLLFRTDGQGYYLIPLQRRGLTLDTLDLLECGVLPKDMGALLGRQLTGKETNALRAAPPFFAYLSQRELPKQIPDGVTRDPWSLMLMRNEVYARHGRVFKDRYLSQYFHGRSWYDPSHETPLTSIESTNVKRLLEWEKSLRPDPL